MKFIPIDDTEVIICVDNCDYSTDNYCKLLSYSKYGFIIVPIWKHCKAGGCRNIGLSVANGEYVFFIDSYNDSLDSGTLFNIDSLLSALYSFTDIAKCDLYELSNKYNKYYRANVWNVFYSMQFLKMHELRFLEWQGYEDFMFNFAILKLNPIIAIYDHVQSELLIWPQKDRYKCPKVNTCYNHAYANTKIDYSISNYIKYSEGERYFKQILGYVPVEYLLEQIRVNAGSAFGTELAQLIKNNEIIDIYPFTYIFAAIEFSMH